MYSLAQVAHPDFARSWHEAVALVQEVASQLDPQTTVPGPEDLLINDDGTLIFGFASETSEAPVTSLGRLLKALLQGTVAPNGLRELAEENSSDSPAHTTLPGFRRALSFYERPNRANDILAVAGRLASVRVQRDAPLDADLLRDKLDVPVPEPEDEAAASATSAEDAEIQRLRRVFSARPEPRKFRWRYPKRYERAAIAGAALGGLLLFIAGFAASGASPRHAVRRMSMLGASSSAPPPDQPVRTEDSPVDVSTAGEAVATASRPRPVEPAVEEARRPNDRRQANPHARREVPVRQDRPPAIKARSPRSGAPSAATASDAVVASVGVLPADPLGTSDVTPERYVDLSPAPVVPAPAERSRGGGGIYTSADAGVQPPRLLRPQLPSEPPPGATTGFLEIVVNERGLVDQVKLLSPTGHYHDRMMVAAAKAWRFRPALLDGRPVRFRTLIPINIHKKE